MSTLWNRLFLDPVALRAARLWIGHSRIGPLGLTAISVALALVSAACFLDARPLALCAGVVVFQLSTLVDCMDGLTARLRPGSGSVLALVADHVTDPWRVIANVLALAHGQVQTGSDPTLYVWAAVFLSMHFMDWTLPKTIAKVRGAYRELYEPRLTRLDRGLLRCAERLARARLKLVLFGTHEREWVVLLAGPLLGAIGPALALGTLLTVAFFLLRLCFDTALVKRELVEGTREYLGDSENAWEAGAAPRGAP